MEWLVYLSVGVAFLTAMSCAAQCNSRKPCDYSYHDLYTDLDCPQCGGRSQ